MKISSHRRLLTGACGMLTCGLLMATASPAVARAAAGPTTASVSGTVLKVTAATGVQNTLSIGGTSAAIELIDGAGVTAGTGCRTVNATTVRCSGTGTITELAVAAGDRDDVVLLTAPTFGRITGGSGNDLLRSFSNVSQARLSGNDGNDTIDGGPLNSLFGQNGNDVLTGGIFLSGGAGDDRLRSFAGGQTLDGGPGNDRGDAGAGTDDRCLNLENTLNCESFTPVG
ncbi:hypothetical protein AB0G04_19205 [Actinoplanes sp. NPDC023801]|uniref:calcium-binding protein n=1 Tax=Actinoplanes sp. NPDC023801 TaxID=3154595 RepID=UPI0033D9F77F